MATIKISFPFRKHFFDKRAEDQGLFLCGVDEVGRGCLAGPVVSTALILKPKSIRQGRMPSIQDSKVLTAEEREAAYRWLTHNSWYGTAILNHRTIDACNIYQATLRAMKRAVIQMHVSHPQIKISAIAVDAMPLEASFLWPEKGDSPRVIRKEDLEMQQIIENPWDNVLYFYNGEKQSKAIAAASIIAKVTRDRLMQSLAYSFPGYSLEQHKGYAVPSHKQHITEHGRSIIHRLTFNNEYPDTANMQSSIDFENYTPEFCYNSVETEI